MELFAPSLAIVDLETTGTRAAEDRITEVGIVRVDAGADGDAPQVSEWSSLVDPGVGIPAAIQALTGITDAMVAGAPSFSTIAAELAARLEGCLFIAHNARFDHGFLKHEFARAGRSFSSRPLCTVRLSRRLYPDAQGHGLDAIVARHGLSIAGRHRALGDARAVWAFIQDLYTRWPAETIALAVKRVLKTPSLPAHLPPDALARIPEEPGVYLFYGENAMPLYIGKSVNVRERVGAHFASDWRHETDLRLAQEIRRIEFETTAGELGALLRESMLIKTLLPAHNRALRRKADAGVLVPVAGGIPHYAPAAAIEPASLSGCYGPFASRGAAREMLRALAADHALCWSRLRLERARAGGPCFARQVRRCAGACIGAETADEHDARLHAALSSYLIPPWPCPGPALLRERGANDERTDVHLFSDWCWLGSARDEGELGRLVEAPPRPAFDLDVARLLLRRHAAGTLPLQPIGVPA
jgi:DNA polymerase-3 subunit epsilon